MNKKIIIYSIASSLLAFPAMVFALNFPDIISGGSGESEVVGNVIDNFFGFIWPLFTGFAVLMFIYAGFTFLAADGDPTKIATARRALVWGMVGVAVGLLASSIPFIVNNFLF